MLRGAWDKCIEGESTFVVSNVKTTQGVGNDTHTYYFSTL